MSQRFGKVRMVCASGALIASSTLLDSQTPGLSGGETATNDIVTLTSLAHRHGWHDVDAPGTRFAYQLRDLAHPQEIVIVISQGKPCKNILRGLGVAKQMGLLSIVLMGGNSDIMAAHITVDHLLVAPAEEPQIVVEGVHILWTAEGMSCDGDSVSLTAAMQPSIEDVVLGVIPGLPKGNLRCLFIGASRARQGTTHPDPLPALAPA